jgi:hypothetical protein
MTVQEFIQFCEEYYGEKYQGKILAVMNGYLDKKSERFLDCAAAVLTRRFSRTNRMAPGPAEIEKHLNEILDRIPEVKPPEPKEQLSDEEREEMSKNLLWLSNELKSRSKSKPAIFFA